MYKNYFLLLFIPLLVLFSSCQNQENMLDQQRKEAFIKVNNILASGNVDELDNYITQDIVDHQSEAQGMAAGLAGVKDLFRYFHRVFPELSINVHSMAITGDTLFAYVSFSGTPTEPFMGGPANQPVTSNSVDMVRFEGNKIAEHWGFIDIAEIMKMMPPPDSTMNSMMQQQ